MNSTDMKKFGHESVLIGMNKAGHESGRARIGLIGHEWGWARIGRHESAGTNQMGTNRADTDQNVPKNGPIMPIQNAQI